MQVRILGAHQSSSAKTRSTSILVDGVLAIDAGSVAQALTLDEQDKVRNILITHQHHDHLKDLPGFGLNMMRTGTTNVFCIKETRDAIFAHLLNDVLWPDLTKIPCPEHPATAFSTVEALKPFRVNGYEILAVAVDHAVPTVGYQVDGANRKLFYTSDMGGGGDLVWPHVDPHVLITEVTLPNRLENVARDAKHLTPALLRRELIGFRVAKGYLPRVVVIHVSPQFSDEVKEQVAKVACSIGADITVAEENMVFDV